MRNRKRRIALNLETLEDRKLLDASYDITWPVANTNVEHIVTGPTLQSINFTVTNPDATEGLFGVADGKTEAEKEAAGLIPGGIPIPPNSTLAFSNAFVPGVSWNSFWVAGSDDLSAHIVVDDTPAPAQQATTVVWANPANITYGTPLTSTQLNAHAVAVGLVGDVPGTFVYTPAAGTLLHAGNAQPLSVQFTPTDLVNYAPSSGTASINVVKATPTVTWAKPADILAGTPLSSIQLDAVGSVAGAFAYNPPAGTVLPTGQDQPLQATLTPLNTADYNNASATVLIDVNAQGVPNPHQPPQPPNWWSWFPWNWWQNPPQPPVQTSVHLFNEQHYLQQNPDVHAAVDRGEFTSGYSHFLAFGLREGRLGTPDWTPAVETQYLAANPDVANAVHHGDLHSGYEHFVIWGQYENRQGDPLVIPQSVVQLFSESVYLARYPDVANAVHLGQFPSGYAHFQQDGLYEGRSGSNDWTPAIESAYLAANPDVASAITAHDHFSVGNASYLLQSGYQHYLIWGKAEHRGGAPLVLQLDV